MNHPSAAFVSLLLLLGVIIDWIRIGTIVTYSVCRFFYMIHMCQPSLGCGVQLGCNLVLFLLILMTFYCYGYRCAAWTYNNVDGGEKKKYSLHMTGRRMTLNVIEYREGGVARGLGRMVIMHSLERCLDVSNRLMDL